MDYAVAVEAGNGSAYSNPQVQLTANGEKNDWYYGGQLTFRHDAWDTQFIQVGRKFGDLKLQAQLTAYEDFESGGQRVDDWLQFGARYKLPLGFQLTADYTPDAFGAGETYRPGVQYYAEHDRYVIFGWARFRYFDRSNNFNREYMLEAGYKVNDRTTVTLKWFDSEFFEDNLTLNVRFNLDIEDGLDL